MEDNKKNALYCSHCGALIGEDEDYEEVNGEIVCTECFERNTTTCDRCGEVIWTEDSYGDEYTTLCRHCYENHYTRCSCCDALLHEDDAYHLDGYDYCSECYHDEVDKNRSIHDYGYKPEPIFYGDSKRYFGIELEIDGAGKDSDNADEILAIANRDNEHIYIKGDGSLDDSPYYNMHEEILLAYCGCYGIDSEDVELLLEYGYTCDEIEEMLMDTNLLHEALRDVKYMCGESLYESCYGGAW